MPKNESIKVAVCSRSFSQNPILREELLKEFPNSKFNDEGLSLKGDSLIQYLDGQDRAIIALEPMEDEVLKKLPNLKVISKYGVGLNNLSEKTLSDNDVKLGWTGGVNKRAVAELTLGFALSMMRDIPNHTRNLRANTWKPEKGRNLSALKVGIVGCGHIGKELVSLLRPFGCEIVVYDIKDFSEFYAENGVEAVSFEDLLKTSDLVTLHVPLNESTRNMISTKELDLMKPDSYLINCARGGLVDEQALYHALTTKLKAASFDVFDEEPATNNKLLTLDNFQGTPHLGGSTQESILKMGRAAISGLTEHYEASHFKEFF